MSSIQYIKQLISDTDGIVRGVLTGTQDLEKQNPNYEKLRKRLEALQPLVGPPPEFISKSPDLWRLWNSYVKGSLQTYESRREFLDKELVKFYEEKIAKIATGNFETELIQRDLAILDQVGSGGYGVVYSADHIVLQEKRAIKKLEPLFANDEETVKALRRFSREASILYKIAHKNIVRVYDAGIAGGFPYIVMEYVDGDNLGKMVEKNGTFASEAAKNIILQIAQAITAAHEVGIIHRDLKPSNIMWDGERAVILDFGTGQWLEKNLSTRLTTGLVGTVGYIADELQGDPQLLNKNLDCYALGVIYHFLLTGRTPNTGDPTYYMNQSGVPTEAQNIILKAMAPPAKRHIDAAAFLADITK